MLFRSSRWFERLEHDSLRAKFCNFHLDGSFRSVIAVYHCAQLVYFSTEKIILSSKTSLSFILDGNL